MPVPQPEEVLELASELRDARSRVIDLEARWASFFNPAGVSEESAATESTPFLKPRIISFLEARPDMNFNVASVSGALIANENSVGPYLSDLARAGKIERRGRGLYGALRQVHAPGEEEFTF